MTVPQSRFFQCAGKTIHVELWGKPAHDAVVIWHGVTGTACDHSVLAQRLAERYQVICPDAIGCGLSDWPSDTEQSSLEFHVQVVDDLLGQLGIQQTRWIGTSKGGALGMLYAATGKQCTIDQLVLHDVGPGLPEKFRAAITRHIAQPPHFESLPAFQEHLEKTLSRNGLKLTQEQWQNLAKNWHRRSDDGRFTYHYAPALADQFAHHPQNFDLWETYRQVRSDILLIRGEQSSVLTEDDVTRMLNSGPKCRLHTRTGGHISFLTETEQQDLIFNHFETNETLQPIEL